MNHILTRILNCLHKYSLRRSPGGSIYEGYQALKPYRKYGDIASMLQKVGKVTSEQEAQFVAFVITKRRVLKMASMLLPGSFFTDDMYKHLYNLFKLSSERTAEKNGEDSYIDNINGVFLPVPISQGENNFNYLKVFMDVLMPHALGIKPDSIPEWFYTAMEEGPYETKYVKLEKNDVVIDGGAWIGDFSALASYKGCTVYAFEPNMETIERYLNKTAAMNGNITVVPYGLHSTDTTSIFTLGNNAIGGHIAEESMDTAEYGMKINLTTIDTFVNKRNIDRVDFIKADIEGAERDMLKGARYVLKEYAPKLALCTYHLPDDPQVMKELILEANPNYIIDQRQSKLFAYVEEAKKLSKFTPPPPNF